MATPDSAIADQLAEVVLCVNHIVECLEAEEEQAELAFFQQERDDIEREFELRLDELRLLLSHADFEQASLQLDTPHQTHPTSHQQQQRQTQPPPTTHYYEQTPTRAQAYEAPTRNGAQRGQVEPAQAFATPYSNGHSHPHAQPPAAAIAAAAVVVPNPQFSSPPHFAEPPSTFTPLGSPIPPTPSVDPSSPDSVLLVCGPDGTEDGEVWTTHSELRECLAHRDRRTRRYVLPNVSASAVRLLLACVRRRAAASSSTDPDGAWTRTSDLVPSSLVLAVLDACNVLHLPWLFVLLAARAFTTRGADGSGGSSSDLAGLHQLVRESFFAKLPTATVLRAQDAVLHAVFAAEGADAVAEAAAVCNMYWFLTTAADFPKHKAHLRRRAAALADAGHPQMHHVAWLEPPPVAAALAGVKKAAPAPVLWVRIYLELLFAAQVAACASETLPPHVQPQWTSLGFLVHCLHVELPIAASSDNHTATATPLVESRAAMQALTTLCQETPHLRVLSLKGFELEPRPMLVLLATAMSLTTLHLPPDQRTIDALDQLHVRQRFPNLRIVLE